MTVHVFESMGSRWSPSTGSQSRFHRCRFSLLVLTACLGTAAHAEDALQQADHECARSEVLAHVQAQFHLYGPLSQNREYFGFIFRFHGVIESSVVRGNVCGNNRSCAVDTTPAASGVPAGAKVLGEWHTHPHQLGSAMLSNEDVRGAKANSHIRCYTAFYATSNGKIYSWDPRSTSVPVAMGSRAELGSYWDASVPDSQGQVAAGPRLPGPVPL